MTHEHVFTPENARLEALAERFPISSNGAEGLLLYYGFDQRGKVEGKQILDLCAGGSDLTAQLLRMGADATALDLRYKDKKDFIARVSEERGGAPSQEFFDSFEGLPWRYVAGSVTEIPYPDESFDHVLSFYGLFGVLDEDPVLLRKAIDESIRVLKKGGKLQIGPLQGYGLGRFAINNQAVTLGEMSKRDDIVVKADNQQYPRNPIGDYPQLKKAIIEKKI